MNQDIPKFVPQIKRADSYIVVLIQTINGIIAKFYLQQIYDLTILLMN